MGKYTTYPSVRARSSEVGTGQFLLRSGVITFSACRALMSMGGALKVDGKLGLRILGMGKMEDGNVSSKMG